MAEPLLEGCRISGPNVDGAAYAKGMELGYALAQGKTALTRDALDEYRKIMAANQIVSLYAGIQCVNPDDVVLTQGADGRKSLELYTGHEDMVSQSFRWFDKFSSKPSAEKFAYSPETLEEAIRRTNDLFNTSQIDGHPLSEDDKRVLVRDFNRRRLENGWLPNVYAVLENGTAVVRKIGDK
jgi:hypothetical protein